MCDFMGRTCEMRREPNCFTVVETGEQIYLNFHCQFEDFCTIVYRANGNRIGNVFDNPREAGNYVRSLYAPGQLEETHI